MYEGYVKFDGIELVNMERVLAYAQAGYVPPGVKVNVCDIDCEGLGEAIALSEGVEYVPYTTPLADHPPWFDAGDLDAQDFAGLVPLGFQGLSGSARTVEVAETLRDGGVPGRPRYNSKTITASAMLIGRSACGVEAGLSWLTDTLHTICNPTLTCRGTTLELFTCCPAPVCTAGAVDPDSDLEPHIYAVDDDDWQFSEGTMDPGTGEFEPFAGLIATNYVTNPSFETNLSGWSAGGRIEVLNGGGESSDLSGFDTTNGATLAQSSAQHSSGAFSIALTATATGTSRLRNYPFKIPSIVPTRTYRYDAKVRAAATGRVVTLEMQYFDASDVAVGSLITGTASADVTGSWTNIFVSGVAPALAAYAAFRIKWDALAIGEVHYADDITFSATTTPDEFLPTFSRRTDLGYSGTCSAQLVPTADVNYPYVLNYATSFITGLTVGEIYTASGFIRQDTVGTYGMVAAIGTFGVDQSAWSRSPVVFSGGVDWQRFEVTFVATTATQHWLQIEMAPETGTTWPSGEPVQIDALMVTLADPPVDYFDGSLPDVYPREFEWTGTAHGSTSQWWPDEPGLLAGPLQSQWDEVVIRWSVDSLAGQAWYVQPVILSLDGGTIVAFGTIQTGTGPAAVEEAYSPTPEAWRPGLQVWAPGADVDQVNVLHREPMDTADCIDPYRRTYHNVVTVEGPTVVEDLSAGCDGKLVRVEWTWVAGDPFRYGVPRPAVTAMPSEGGAPEFSADDVTTGLVGTVSAASTVCAAPLPLSSCATDPCCPTPTGPPTPPAISDPCVIEPANYTRTAVQLNPGVVPGNSSAALRFVLTNDASPKVGVRIRLWLDPDPDFAVPTECAFIWEARIPFLPADEVLTIDASQGGPTLTCPTDILVDPHLRGAYGGPYSDPIVACGQRYFITVDRGVVYPALPEGHGSCGRTAGASQGNFTYDVDLVPREG